MFMIYKQTYINTYIYIYIYIHVNNHSYSSNHKLQYHQQMERRWVADKMGSALMGPLRE